MEEVEKKKPGRKLRYAQQSPHQGGAPKLITRVEPEVLDWIHSRPEGTRPYIERLVTDDMDRANSGESGQGAESSSAAESEV